MKLSRSVIDIPFSKVSSIINTAAQENWKDVIPMAGGEPQFLPPKTILESLRKYSDQEIYKYSPFLGHNKLIEAIINKLKKRNNVSRKKENIIVLPGGSSCLFSTLKAILDFNDEIILTDPCWEHYRSIVNMIGGKYNVWQLYDSNGELNIEELKSLINEKTKCLLINTPLNPSGKIFNKEELKKILKICEEKKIYLICDEEYEDFIYEDAEHFSPLQLSDNVISLYSMSKGYGVTGLRIGYTVGPHNVIEQIKKVALYTHMYTSSPDQCFATDLLNMDASKHFDDLKKTYSYKLNLFYELLVKIPGVNVKKPKGGLYLFPELPLNHGENAAFTLINKFHLLCVPGDIAGKSVKNNVRFFIGLSDELLIEAAKRIKAYCEMKNVNE